MENDTDRRYWQYYLDYLDQLEQTVLIPMFLNESQDKKVIPISLYPGRLTPTTFGLFIQMMYDCEHILALNYYGLIKLSTGILKENIDSRKMQTKAHMVHFNSLKIEHVEFFNSDLLNDFVKFKNFLVNLRWNK